jgi:hypothetical protein
VSAAPLILPIAATVFLRFRSDREPYRALVLFVAAGAAGLAAFAATQPYAFLDAARFTHDVLEQSRMVREAGSLPYTNQYIGTPKLLYEVKELVLWGLGPLLGLAALWGAVRLAVRPKRWSRFEIVVLAWAVPYVLVTVSFQVKFPRYLLPLYPFLALWAAIPLMEMAKKSRRGRLVRGAVVAGTALWPGLPRDLHAPLHPCRRLALVLCQRPGGKECRHAALGRGVPASAPGALAGQVPGRRLRLLPARHARDDLGPCAGALHRRLGRFPDEADLRRRHPRAEEVSADECILSAPLLGRSRLRPGPGLHLPPLPPPDQVYRRAGRRH